MPTPIIIEDPHWPEPITVIAQATSAYGFVTVEAVGLHTQRHYTTTLPLATWQAIQPQPVDYSFAAPAEQLGLAVESQRLRLAYAADQLLAANNAKVHLLPHQVEAVYGYLLPQPRIRHLLAHDAGAGKTVMAGLLYKELASREPGLRTLIVVPAALTVQWQRELREKFLVEFDIVEREQLRDNGHIWLDSSRLITSLPFARQAEVLATLTNVPWDLVIVDEAHHLAGYERRETQAYRLGRVLAQNTRHLILATATPHKGNATNFLKLLQLLDEGIHDPDIVNRKAPGQRGSPLMLRRLKEEMVDFEGQPLFKRRDVETRCHTIADNPPELALYTALTDYVSKTYRAAERIGGLVKVNTEFAMVILQRRMASSFVALKESLLRRREGLFQAVKPAGLELEWAELEEQPEAGRWEQERQAELVTPAQTEQERQKEIARIDDLLEKLAAIGRSGQETKITALQKILDEIGIAPGNNEKLLVFTEFKDTLDFLRELFEQQWGYSVTQIDGSMSHEQRQQAEADFQQRCQIMIATEAAGEGINLQFCAYMVNYDLPWLPTRLEQRMGRIHRYGQNQEVRIFNLVAADTREGAVLGGLLLRLDGMRKHLGDQVFDVVSALISDVQLEHLLAEVAIAPTTEAAQDKALLAVYQALQQGAARYQQWRDEQPLAIPVEQFRQLQQASRQSRLTPEYAQHFFVDALTELHEAPLDADTIGQPAGDAAIVDLTLHRTGIAQALGLPAHKPLLFSFREGAPNREGVQFLALGTAVFDRLLRLVDERWGAALRQGTKFMDVSLPPGAFYLLWFLSAEVKDGWGHTVKERLFAVQQTAAGYAPAAAASLVDLIPAPATFLVPALLLEWVQDPHPVLEWSLAQQQGPFLAEAQQERSLITRLRQEPLLADAQTALEQADQVYNDCVFAAGVEPADLSQAEARRAQAQMRVQTLRHQFDHENACTLGATRVITAAAVFSLAEPPAADLTDVKPQVAAAAMHHAQHYERTHHREALDVTGEHDQYPYDLHSTGPGGVRCIEVKGTTTGKIWLSENERRAAQRLGKAYYLYVVRDPLSEHPHLTIIRDPLAKMAHDDVLYSGARYVYEARTWHAVADEESTL